MKIKYKPHIGKDTAMGDKPRNVQKPKTNVISEEQIGGDMLPRRKQSRSVSMTNEQCPVKKGAKTVIFKPIEEDVGKNHASKVYKQVFQRCRDDLNYMKSASNATTHTSSHPTKKPSFHNREFGQMSQKTKFSQVLKPEIYQRLVEN